MVMINRKVFKETFGQPFPERVQIRIPNAKQVLQTGLNVVLDNRALWLPEYERVAEWLTDNHGKGLLLAGNCGRGKTVLACRVLPIIINRYCRLITNVYNADDLNTKDEAKRAEILAKHLICVDDVGTEDTLNAFGTRIDMFSRLADRTEKEGKLLLVTTNLSDNELIARYKQRTFDRLLGTTKKIIFNGESLRTAQTGK